MNFTFPRQQAGASILTRHGFHPTGECGDVPLGLYLAHGRDGHLRASRGEQQATRFCQHRLQGTAPFPEAFEVHTTIGNETRSTIQWAHELRRGETVIGSGTVTAVYVSKLAG